MEIARKICSSHLLNGPPNRLAAECAVPTRHCPLPGGFANILTPPSPNQCLASCTIMSRRQPPPPRRMSSYHYQTFPTAIAPPSSRGRPPLSAKSSSLSPSQAGVASGSSSLRSGNAGNGGGHGSGPAHTPIPTRQLIVLAVISLAEQTALNSISPYLPEMATTFPEVDTGKAGLFVGIIASSFAAAQVFMPPWHPHEGRRS